MATEAANDSQRAGVAVEKYSVFTAPEKWSIVAMVSYAAWFSTASSFIYYPALYLLSQRLSASIDKINLTITAYMAVATIAPALVGDAADILGRRPMYMITLSMYITANITIALSKSYSTLLSLRVLQALAISGILSAQVMRMWLMSLGTFSIAYGVVIDIASPVERGSFVSAVSFA